MVNINNKERELLKILSIKGPLTPLEISVEQLEMPDKISQLISKLEKKGYISKKTLNAGPEEAVITLSEKGRKALKD